MRGRTTMPAMRNCVEATSRGAEASSWLRVADPLVTSTSAHAPWLRSTPPVMGTNTLGPSFREMSRCRVMSALCPSATAASAWNTRAVTTSMLLADGTSSCTTIWHAPRTNTVRTMQSSSDVSGMVGISGTTASAALACTCFHS